jgi:hypothetical protein
MPSQTRNCPMSTTLQAAFVTGADIVADGGFTA